MSIEFDQDGSASWGAIFAGAACAAALSFILLILKKGTHLFLTNTLAFWHRQLLLTN